jgi:hypothetical protein
MSSNALHRLTEKKGKQLSKFLGIDSVPSTQLIANMQSRINNPLFELSMTDYEAMCGNKIMVRMMSKVIGCEEKQLKKFCKYINVFAENIESSPKSIKNKMKATNSINASMRRGSLHALPDDILEKIVNKYKTLFSKVKYKLKDWIPLENLNWVALLSNPNAIDLLKKYPEKIYRYRDLLSENPNPAAIELLQKNQGNIDWEKLSQNPNSAAIELLKKYPENISWHWLSKNPNPAAIELLEANTDKIDWLYLSSNPAAMDLLKANRDEIDWQYLSKNPNPEAIELLKEYPDEIDWRYLSGNPSTEAIELLKSNRYEIDWRYLSGNPNPEAIELLKKNQAKIDWERLSANPNPEAIKLLKKNQGNISFYYLSSNPAAIELLKANPKKIHWLALSENPAIFDEVLE